MVVIKGINKVGFVDYPPYTASTIFLSGCNFRCGFCHNPGLVINTQLTEDIPEEEIFDYLKEKKDWIDGVCITGGEPTLQKSLPDFIKKFKDMDLLVKLDTNGTDPEMLKQLIEEKLLDKVAMDIKSGKERYEEICRCGVDIEKIQKSIDILKDSDIDFEFRTTVVPGLIGIEEIESIGKWTGKAKNYAIQNFRGKKVELLDKSLEEKEGYNPEELKGMKKIAEKYFENVEIRE